MPENFRAQLADGETLEARNSQEELAFIEHDIAKLSVRPDSIEVQHDIAVYNRIKGKLERYDKLTYETDRYRTERWKNVLASDVYQELKYGAFADILQLLFDQQITPGKAAEAIAERAHGLNPQLPK